MLSKFLKLFRVLMALNCKTLRFNFYYFPFKEAIKFPVYVDRTVVFNTLRGNVVIIGKISPGIVHLGKGKLGTLDNNRTRSTWDVLGNVILGEGVTISRGANISVGKEAKLTLSKNVIISYTAKIICHNEITFGEGSMISWQSYVIDTDFHPIFDLQGKKINENKPILIGDNVWIGFNCLILKGVVVSNNTIVGANSVLGKTVSTENVILAGNPAKIAKENIYWKFK